MGTNPRIVSKEVKKNIELYDEIKSRTNFLSETIPNPSILTIIHCLRNNITELPICKGHPNGNRCSNKVTWSHRTNNFREFCSSKCAHSVPETYEKTKITSLKNTGCENPSQSKEAKEKRKRTNLMRYGVENTFQGEQFKNKIRETSIRKYGTKHPMQSKEIREKAEATN